MVPWTPLLCVWELYPTGTIRWQHLQKYFLSVDVSVFVLKMYAIYDATQNTAALTDFGFSL